MSQGGEGDNAAYYAELEQEHRVAAFIGRTAVKSSLAGVRSPHITIVGSSKRGEWRESILPSCQMSRDERILEMALTGDEVRASAGR